MKIVEGKDRPKKTNGQFAFPPKWEQQGYNKTIDLLLEMTEPIHGTGKVVMGDSGFFVAGGIVALHMKGVWGQFLIKKRKYWPRFVPGDYIDEYMRGKPLGFSKTFVQVIEGTRFLIHCMKDHDYVRKIMLMHGLLDEIQDLVAHGGHVEDVQVF